MAFAGSVAGLAGSASGGAAITTTSPRATRTSWVRAASRVIVPERPVVALTVGCPMLWPVSPLTMVTLVPCWIPNRCLRTSVVAPTAASFVTSATSPLTGEPDAAVAGSSPPLNTRFT